MAYLINSGHKHRLPQTEPIEQAGCIIIIIILLIIILVLEAGRLMSECQSTLAYVRVLPGLLSS